MRISGMMLIMMFLGVGVSSAATINLTDGSLVQGDVIKQDAKSIQINVDGVTMTYYADEIKDIDGRSFADLQPAPIPAAVQSAAAVAPTETAPAVVPPAAAPGTISDEKRALILKFIDVFGTRQALTNNFDAMIKQIAAEKPDEADKIRQRVKVDEIIERLLPIYDRNFSSDDLKAFIAFYGSDEGKKLITTIPELMKESVKESVKYMEEKFPEVKS